MPALTLKAKCRTTCAICFEIVPVGGDVYALEGVAGLMHPACASAHCKAEGCPLLPPVCKHFVRRGYCLFAESCFYRHPEAQKGSLPCKNVKLRGSVTQIKVRNRFRAATFRRFLIHTYGRQRLSQGTGILDVAGGTGELSFELLNLNHLASTVVDPRPQLKLDRQCRCLEAGFYFRNPVFQAYVDSRWSDFKGGNNARMPPHLRMQLNAELVHSLAGQGCATRPPDIQPGCDPGTRAARSPQGPEQQPPCSGSATGSAQQACFPPGSPMTSSRSAPVESAGNSDDELLRRLQSAFDEAASVRWTTKALQTGGHEGDHACSEYSCTCQDVRGLDAAKGSNAAAVPLSAEQLASVVHCWRDASIIVGIHPDQATDHIVEFARMAGKPFAVVPCCVFPSEFPNRRLNGQPVRKYEEYIEYLISLAPCHIQVTDLMFEGRNKCVFCKDWTRPHASDEQQSDQNIQTMM